jgi:hypothetical protein
MKRKLDLLESLRLMIEIVEELGSCRWRIWIHVCAETAHKTAYNS